MFWIQLQCGLTPRVITTDAGSGQPSINFRDPEELLFEAITNGNLSRVKQLMSSGINSNTILHNSKRWEGASILGTAAYEGHLNIIRYLLEMKVSINFRDPCLGRTALHWACMGKKLDAVRYLIKFGADVNLADRDNVTPILTATMNKLCDICKVLIDNGANVDQVDRLNSSPLHFACNHGDTKLICEIIKGGCVRNNLDIIGRGTPLANLAMNNDFENCYILMEAGYRLGNEKWVHSNQLESNKATHLVSYRMKNPPSLKSACRMTIRRRLGGHYLSRKIKTLNFPASLKSYLLLETLWCPSIDNF
ncbi:hypothetical protein ScPMuIL_018266 [Solemya velum]